MKKRETPKYRLRIHQIMGILKQGYLEKTNAQSARSKKKTNGRERKSKQFRTKYIAMFIVAVNAIRK